MKIATIIFAVLLAGITYQHPFVCMATMGLIVALARPVLDGWIRRRDYLPCLIVAFFACLFTNSIVWGVQQKPRDVPAKPAPVATPVSVQSLSAVATYQEPEVQERPADNPHASGPDASAGADQQQRALLNQVRGAAAGEPHNDAMTAPNVNYGTAYVETQGSQSSDAPKTQHVSGYTRSNGTHVNGYDRR